MTEPHRFSLRVRYEETDRMGVVYHSNHFKYFETGRTELMRGRGITYRDMEEGGTLLAVTEAHANYRGRVTYDDVIVVETRLSLQGRARIRFDYRILREADGGLVCEGHTCHVCVDRDGRPVRPPAVLKENILSYGRENS